MPLDLPLDIFQTATANPPITPADNGCVQNRDLIHLHYPEISLSPITITTRVTLVNKLKDFLDLQVWGSEILARTFSHRSCHAIIFDVKDTVQTQWDYKTSSPKDQFCLWWKCSQGPHERCLRKTLESNITICRSCLNFSSMKIYLKVTSIMKEIGKPSFKGFFSNF